MFININCRQVWSIVHTDDKYYDDTRRALGCIGSLASMPNVPKHCETGIFMSRREYQVITNENLKYTCINNPEILVAPVQNSTGKRWFGKKFPR